MKKDLLRKTILLIFLFSFLIPSLIWAAGVCEPCDGEPCDPGLTCERGKCRGCPSDGIVFCNPLQNCDFQELIEKLIDFIFVVAIVIAPIMIIVAAFYFLTSGGDPEKVRTAKRIIFWTLIGLFIVLLAKGIPSIVKQILEGGQIGPPPPVGLTPALLFQMGDLNNDCVINWKDLIIVSKAFGSKPGDPNWNPNADFKKDNLIDNYDLEIFKFNYGLGVKCS